MGLIIAFGDNITYGIGTDTTSSYPKQIENKTGLKIINAGVEGEFSSEGLIRLPSILENKPELVILCHGANDIYYKHDISQLKNNLLEMIELIQQSGSKVLLVGVSNFALLSKDIHKLYDEVAEEGAVLFEDNILRIVFSSNLLKTDYRHPNTKGYERMADAFIEILQLPKIVTSFSSSKCYEYKKMKGMC